MHGVCRDELGPHGAVVPKGITMVNGVPCATDSLAVHEGIMEIFEELRTGHTVNHPRAHLNVLLSQITNNIQHKVRERMKQSKIKIPSKYDSTNNHQKFYTWLDSVLDWLRAYNVCGPEADRYQLVYLRQHLSGEAKSWYAQEIDHRDNGRDISFAEAMCRLHERFVHSSTAARATEEFMCCQYCTQTGVESFAAELLRRTWEMIYYPYELNLRLFNGLPDNIHSNLRTFRGITPEYNTWSEILKNTSTDHLNQSQLKQLEPI